MVAPTIITGPLHAHGARTPEEFIAKQWVHIGQLRDAYPAHTWHDPWTSVASPAARINSGRWIVDCPCRNGASASPEWRLAACFECGAIYRSVVLPDDREAIEALLLLRPRMRNRNWAAPETLDDLLRENEAHLGALVEDVG